MKVGGFAVQREDPLQPKNIDGKQTLLRSDRSKDYSHLFCFIPVYYKTIPSPALAVKLFSTSTFSLKPASAGTSTALVGGCQILLQGHNQSTIHLVKGTKTYTVLSSLQLANIVLEPIGFHATALTTSECPESTSIGCDAFPCHT